MKRYLPLLAILVLLGAFAAQVATAAASSPSASPTSARFDSHLVEVEFEDEGEEGEEEEFELEECEAEDFGFEFDEEGEEGEEELTEAEEEELEEDCEEAAKKKGDDGKSFVTAPAACQISQAESTITTLPASGQVRLSVRYRTWAPTSVAVGVKLRDRKGAVGIESTTKHLGDHGVLNITANLSDSLMDRALDASEFDISLRAPKTPAFCAGDLEQRLRSDKHASPTARRVYSN